MHEQRFLFITILLVSLIGAPAVYSVVKEPAKPKVSESQTTAPNVRLPASVQPALEMDSTHQNLMRSKSVVLDYPCTQLNKVHEVDGTLLRLKGGKCLDENWQNVSIVNHSNGFTGSVIFLKGNQFTTDFIDLKEGENKIEIQATDEKGKAISQSFTIRRRVPASL